MNKKNIEVLNDKLISSREIADIAVKVMDKRKADEIEMLHVEDLTVISEYLVLGRAGNNTHAKSIIGEIEKTLEEEHGIYPLARDGYNSSNWVVVDFNVVMIHVFFGEEGEFYADALKTVWADAENIKINIEN